MGNVIQFDLGRRWRRRPAWRQRQRPRVPLPVPVTVHGSRGVVARGRTSDISMRGMRIHLDLEAAHRICPGALVGNFGDQSEIDVTLTLPLGKISGRVSARCAVVNADRSRSDRIVLGLSFIRIRRDSIRHLRRFVQLSAPPRDDATSS